jgi:D-3-phosphoglycerate dehydrogenase
MPTNRKRLVVPTSMGAGGFEVLKTRDDVEVIPFPPMISSPEFNALLRADGEVNGAILGLTRFGETEAQNAKGLWSRASASATTPSTCRRSPATRCR